MSKGCCKPDPAKNFKSRAHYFENEILFMSGLTLGKELLVKDVEIDYPEKNNFLHTTICGEAHKDHPLVLLHGYGGSRILYYPMLKELSEHYNVFCLDMLGMGLSSRPKTKFNNTKECIDFFVESTEAWRKSMNIEKIYLGGHSFGGYMACHYALKYPERVKKLLLLSPVGITHDQEVQNFE
jgi:pimeloyl-ACP methyl ester carboxylesterase